MLSSREGPDAGQVAPALALRGMLREGVDVIDVPGLGTRRIVLRSYLRGKPPPTSWQQ